MASKTPVGASLNSPQKSGVNSKKSPGETNVGAGGERSHCSMPGCGQYRRPRFGDPEPRKAGRPRDGNPNRLGRARRRGGDQPGSFRACLAAPIIALSTAINSDRTVGGPIFLPSERWHRRRAAKVGWRMDGPKGPARPRRREAGGDRQTVRGASITETDRSMLSGLQRGGPR
jgi:hypothetical protein